MEQIINLQGIEEKVSKTGRKYCSLNTDIGKCTCFEQKVEMELRQAGVGSQIRVNIEERNGFKNITSFIGYGKGVITEKIGQVTPTPFVSNGNKGNSEALRKTAICMINNAVDLCKEGKIPRDEIKKMAHALMELHVELAE